MVREPKTRRVFRCIADGWESSSFGNKKRIDGDLLSAAQMELKQHLAEAHNVGLFDPAVEVDVVIEKVEEAEKDES